MNVVVHQNSDDLVHSFRFEVDSKLSRADLSRVAGQVEVLLAVGVLNGGVDDRPEVFHRVVARFGGGKDVERVSEDGPPQKMRFVSGSLGGLGSEVVVELQPVHPFVHQGSHSLPCRFRGLDNDSRARPPSLRRPRRDRTVYRQAREPESRAANRSARDCCPPRHERLRIVARDVRAGRYAEREIQFVRPLLVMAVPGNQARKNRRAADFDHLRPFGDRHFCAFAHLPEPPAFDHNRGIGYGRAPSPVNQRPADNGNGLRPRRRSPAGPEKQHDRCREELSWESGGTIH